jgi:hypothetical protein
MAHVPAWQKKFRQDGSATVTSMKLPRLYQNGFSLTWALPYYNWLSRMGREPHGHFKQTEPDGLYPLPVSF